MTITLAIPGTDFALSGWLLFLAPVALYLIWYTYQIIYNLYFHPLSSYPGPKLYAATRLAYLHASTSGTLAFKLQNFHCKYGDVVRIAPDELSYNTAEAWKDIYGHRPGHPQMQKDILFYGHQEGFPESLITTDDKDHARVRRLLAHAFSDKAMREQEPLIKVYVDLLIQRLHETVKDAGEKKAINIVSRYNWTTFDLFGDLAFGEPFGCLQDSAYHPWVSMIFYAIKLGVFITIPMRYPALGALLKLFIPKSLLAKRKFHQDMVVEKVGKRLETKTERKDFVSYILKHKDDELSMSVPEIWSNSSILIVAGSETTATLLSGATHYLLRNPKAMQRLKDEVRGTFKDDNEITLTSVGNLKYMLAVLDETLRIYPPVAGGLPRRVGKDGDTVCGKWVPGGTALSVGHYVTYHDPKNFLCPEEFHPERFLGDPLFADDSFAALQPFHIGPRNCIGRNLAYAELRLILAKMIWNFDMELAEPEKDWLEGQKIFGGLWEKGPLNVRLSTRR